MRLDLMKSSGYLGEVMRGSSSSSSSSSSREGGEVLPWSDGGMVKQTEANF